jgi:hypothetical protein
VLRRQYEDLRAEWPVAGTTGYEFLNQLEAAFIDPAGYAAIEARYRALVRASAATGFDAPLLLAQAGSTTPATSGGGDEDEDEEGDFTDAGRPDIHWRFELVKPDGSNRWCANLRTRASSGTPYCNAIEHVVAKLSMTPESVEPSFAITMKISPGVPSSYMPIVR